MPEQLLTTEEPATQPAPTTTAPDDELREWARKHVESVRKLKMHVTAYVIGMLVLTPIWALTQWADHGAFKHLTFNTEGHSGDWEPWILYVGLIWGLILAISAVRVHFDRPATNAEIDREIERVQRRL